MKIQSLLAFAIATATSAQLICPGVALAGGWEDTRSGTQIRVTEGDYSHLYHEDPNGYYNNADDNTTTQQAEVSGPLRFAMNAQGELIKKSGSSSVMDRGIQDVDIAPNNLVWTLSKEILGQYVRETLAKSSIGLDSAESTKALQNVVDISIPALEVLESMVKSKKQKMNTVSKANLTVLQNLILLDPIAILVLTAEAKMSHTDEVNKKKIVESVENLVSRRDAKWISFLRNVFVQEVIAYANESRQWRFDTLLNAPYSLYISSYAEKFIQDGPKIFGATSRSK